MWLKFQHSVQLYIIGRGREKDRKQITVDSGRREIDDAWPSRIALEHDDGKEKDNESAENLQLFPSPGVSRVADSPAAAAATDNESRAFVLLALSRRPSSSRDDRSGRGTAGIADSDRQIDTRIAVEYTPGRSGMPSSNAAIERNRDSHRVTSPPRRL